MIKKFENFINESIDNFFTKLEPKDITPIITKIKPGDAVLLRCHWAVSEYAIPTLCKKLSKYSKYEYVKVDCSALAVDDVKSVLSEPGKLYLLNEIHRTDQDTLLKLLHVFRENQKSAFIATTTSYEDEDKDFFWTLRTQFPKSFEKFRKRMYVID